jgi:hypothetical protein
MDGIDCRQAGRQTKRRRASQPAVEGGKQVNGQNRRYVPQAVVRGATCVYACSCACAGVRVVCLGACTCMRGRRRPERYRGFLSLISDINVSRVVWLVIWLCHLKTDRVKRRTGGGLREWWSPTRTRRGEARQVETVYLFGAKNEVRVPRRHKTQSGDGGTGRCRGIVGDGRGEVFGG